jgi:menaquinone-specific isochorismate synthase
MTATSLALDLAATTRRLEQVPDLVDELAPDGFAWLTGDEGFVTAGVAARIAVDDIEGVLAAIPTSDEVERPGTGAIAVGALPFDEVVCGELVIPARVVGRAADGVAWVTEIGPSTPPRVERSPAPTRFVVERSLTREGWRDAVEAILERIAARNLEKAVLAREVLVTVDADLDARTVVERLSRSQAGSFVFAAEGLVGASPELLVRRRGSSVFSRPMAGTVARVGSDTADDRADAALRRSTKDASEHGFVVDAVVAGLRSCGVEIDAVGDRELARLTDVSHLATSIEGHLTDRSRPSALALARALHPTPAVGGTPREAALDALRELEPFERGRYAGPVGWVGADGDGEWAVALRCAELDRNRARLFAGAGIVAGSDPDAEWDETEAKFEPMLRAIVRP